MSEEKEEKAIVPSIVTPPVEPSKIIENFKKIQDLKRKLLDETDFVLIKGKPYIKKSGWRKLQFAFNISDEIIKEEREEREKTIVWRMWVKVTAPNGRTAVGVGSASSNEREWAHPEHDVYALCHTRAKNRAISDLLGLGEVSAEEMLAEEVPEVEEAPPKKAEVPKQEAKVEAPKVEFEEEFPKLKEEALKELNADILSQLPWKDMASGQLAPRNEWKVPAWIRVEEPNLNEVQQNILNALKEKLNKDGFLIVDGMRLFFNETKKYIRRVFE
jgi:hypothetical protein